MLMSCSHSDAESRQPQSRVNCCSWALRRPSEPGSKNLHADSRNKDG